MTDVTWHEEFERRLEVWKRAQEKVAAQTAWWVKTKREGTAAVSSLQVSEQNMIEASDEEQAALNHILDLNRVPEPKQDGKS